MKKYVEEIKQVLMRHSTQCLLSANLAQHFQIMETMSHSEDVAGFMQILGLGSQYESVYGISGRTSGAGKEKTGNTNGKKVNK